MDTFFVHVCTKNCFKKWYLEHYNIENSFARDDDFADDHAFKFKEPYESQRVKSHIFNELIFHGH